MTNKCNKRFAGLNCQQRGDLIMNTVAARAIKEKYPDSHFTLGIAKPLADMLPLFLHNKYIDDIHIWDSYDGLNAFDEEYLEFMNFDLVFNPMPSHKQQDWWINVKNQTEEVCLMHNLNPPEDLSCYLNKWFEVSDKFNNYVAIYPFAGIYRGLNNEKCLSISRSQDIVDLILDYGYKVLQCGASEEPRLKNVLKLNSSYFESYKNILGCKFAIGGDTGLTWGLSAYQFPVLGLYSNQYYNNKISVIQPINKNAIYLDDKNVNDISLEKIEEGIKKLIC